MASQSVRHHPSAGLRRLHEAAQDAKVEGVTFVHRTGSELQYIDLNADCGEGFDDTGLLRYVTSVNISCGAHAGTPDQIANVVAMAAERQAGIGAHVSFVDREGFGRRPLDTPPLELRDQVLWQASALNGLARGSGTRVRYIKPHGALYHTCMAGGEQGEAVFEAAQMLGMPLLLMPHSPWASYGEGFAERAYDGELLRPRDKEGAVIHDPHEAAAQAVALAAKSNLHSICVHGDSPGAVEVAKAVRSALEEAGYKLGPFCGVPSGPGEALVLKAPESVEEKLVQYLAEGVVNGHQHPGAVGQPPSIVDPLIPNPRASSPVGTAHSPEAPPEGLKQVFEQGGAAGFAKAVRAHEGLRITDTTWRDAHQSLLATRVRTVDMKAIAPATSHVLANAYSLECWGGATFDVSMRFLHECPWQRLATLREEVPNVPLQMLLRGANAVGYTSYPDNVVQEFCRQAVRTGMDVFRVFDSLNYIENMRLGIDAVGEAGGIVEGTICYTGDITDPARTKYNLEYYLDFAHQLVDAGCHVICVKDMAGLLKPRAARMLISALRSEFPHVPIHVHTHDTAGTGVASMIACAESGADAVDACCDAMAGLTSQPHMGALIHEFHGTPLDTGIELEQMMHLNTYWEGARGLYAPFETGQKSAGADVYINEIPGGQYTNLQFQALAMGQADRWPAIKNAYAEANQMFGDIIKVTPSSKVVGDLALWMVSNNLDKQSTLAQASTLNFPTSVVEFLQGHLGHPIGGFPEPFCSDVLGNLPRIEGRPGSSMQPFDYDGLRTQLEADHDIAISECDLSSAAQYPQVFSKFAEMRSKYGDLSVLPTRQFLQPMSVGESVSIPVAGRSMGVKFLGMGELHASGKLEVLFEVNGRAQSSFVTPTNPSAHMKKSQGGAEAGAPESAPAQGEKADPAQPGQVGSPMPGGVVSIHVGVGDTVKTGEKLAVLDAMKMETVVAAPINGTVARVTVNVGDQVAVGDLLLRIE